LKTVRSESDGFVGRPENIYILVNDGPLYPQHGPKLKKRRTNQIIEVIGDDEVCGAEIARRLDTKHENISGELLRLCSVGKLIRRRQLGEIRGKTHAREFYLYRKA
jgi:hypothetical protein